eukprot:g2785.t1
MADEAVATFQAMTAVSEEEAKMYMEMSGGDLEMAMNIFFGGGAGGGGDGGGGGGGGGADAVDPDLPPFFSFVWQSKEIPDAWLSQTIEFGAEDGFAGALGIPQPKNGPCGVLAALQALLIKQYMAEGLLVEAGKPVPSPAGRPDLVASAIASLICPAPMRCGGAGGARRETCVLCKWADGMPRGKGVALEEGVPTADLARRVQEQAYLDAFTSPGGVCLILYSALLSRGVDQARLDMASSGTEPPLVVGPNSVCSSDLMSLLLRGVASANIFAYDPLAAAKSGGSDSKEDGDGDDKDKEGGGAPKVDWPAEVEVGLLSTTEKEFNMPVCDRLKAPAVPVWILHGGDHFTTAFAVDTAHPGLGLGRQPAGGDGGGKDASSALGAAAKAASVSALSSPSLLSSSSSPAVAAAAGPQLVPTTGASSDYVMSAGDRACAAAAMPQIEPKDSDKDKGKGKDQDKVEEGKDTAEEDGNAAAAAAVAAPPAPFALYHWNGLPPAGPRMARLEVTAVGGTAGPARASHKAVFYKPLIGEIYDIVQARPEDKRGKPNRWEEWKYEVVLVHEDDPEEKGEDRPKDAPRPPIFPQGEPVPGEPWRCASCYAKRFKTMCFGQNDAGAESCVHCGKARADCGWSLWMDFSELPGGYQHSVTQRHAPKIITLLQTKWPGAKVDVGDLDNAPSV